MSHRLRKGLIMSNKVYDILKDISLCWMPLGTAFLGVVLESLNVPYSGTIMTTIKMGWLNNQPI